MRILMITSRFPLPPWRGNQIRTLQWLDALERHDCAVLAPPAPPGVSLADGVVHIPYELAPLARLTGLARAVINGRPLQEGWYTVEAARRQLLELIERAGGPAWDLAIVQMVRCGWALDLIRRAAPGLPVVLDAIDSMGLHFERAAADRGPALRPATLFEARRCHRRERWLAQQADLTIAVAGPDLEALAPPDGRGRVIPVAGRLPATILPEGTTLPEKTTLPDGTAPGEPGLILLSGNLGYRPTVRGALWFAGEVWPALRRRFPACRWRLAGSRPPRAIRRLARLPGVELVTDPADLAVHFAAATVAIAPMQTGSGVPMKVLEAWAAGVPIVATPEAAAGLAPGSIEALEVATGRDSWVASLAGLLADEERRRALTAAGRSAWKLHYHPEVVRRALREAAVQATEPGHRGMGPAR